MARRGRLGRPGDADVTTPTINSLDRTVIESVLKMGSGYVLDFSDRTFAEFFEDFNVQIDEQAFQSQGTSKANRLRAFIRTAQADLVGNVLAALLERRLLWDPDGINEKEVKHYRALVTRLGGPSGASNKSATGRVGETEDELLRRVFKPEVFARLPVDVSMSRILVARMEEAHRCIENSSHLAAVILCGSVLEGMCLGYGSRHPERANRAFAAQYNKTPPPFHDWKLREWIDVLARLGDLSPNIEKFGHGLRDFRNYVHPAEQLARGFSPDQHTARIGFQVVIAAADDLVRASATGKAPP
jgi:hypothetical protein